jgi:hypothetical protein
MLNTLEWALLYAERGWHVHPLIPSGHGSKSKRPATAHGFYDATTDSDTIRQWFGNKTKYNLGIRTGKESGIVIIDIDPRNGGTLENIGQYLDIEKSLQVNTGGGGYHLYYRYHPEVKALNLVFGPGVDIKTDGGYVVAPPSVTGKYYTWEDWSSPIGELPETLISLGKQRKSTVLLGGDTPVLPPAGRNLPGDDFNRRVQWPLLIQDFGFTLSHDNGDGVSFWTRPGKETQEGHSATLNYEGRSLFHVFSDSIDGLDSGRSYTKFSLWTLLEHGGDYSAAASDIGQRGIPFRYQGTDQEMNESTFKGVPPSSELEHKERNQEPKEQSDGYLFRPAIDSDHFISQYIGYSAQLTDAPCEYHEAAALTLLSLVTGNAAAYLSTHPEGLRTNLFLVFVGPTSRFRKSTVQKYARSFATKIVSPDVVLPDKSTPESFTQRLAGMTGLASLWLPDEFGTQLAAMTRKDYMEGMEGLLLTLYDCPESYRHETVSGGVTVISQPRLSVLATAQAESLAVGGTNLVGGGLFPRFGIVYPDPNKAPQERGVGNVPAGLKIAENAILERLRGILQSGIDTVTFSDEALELLSEEGGRLNSYQERLGVMAYKVATLVTLADMRDHVGVGEAKSAVAIVSRWAEGVDRLAPVLLRTRSDSRLESSLNYLLRILERHGGMGDQEFIAKKMELPPKVFNDVVLMGEQRGLIAKAEGSKVWTLKK